MLKDPVCWMELDPAQVAEQFTFEGTTYSFCSHRCVADFQQEPQKYLQRLQSDVVADRKVVIVGAGGVGATFAYQLTLSGLANSIVLVDVNRELAEGHVMDLQHGLSFVPPCSIQAGDYSECRDADLVVITAGAHMKPGETRTDLIKKNYAIFKEIIPKIVEHNPRILLIVANPVDVLTYLTLKLSGYPMNRVIGSGTVLDSSRFRFLLGKKCSIAPASVQAFVIGEHGDSEVAVWSQVNIGGVPFSEFCEQCLHDCSREEKEAILDQVKNAAYEIVKRKGGTNFAVSLAISQIVAAILRGENKVLTVSAFLDDYLGIDDVCLSVPAVLNQNGLSRVIRISLDEDERSRLQESAAVLKNLIAQVLD